MSDTLKTILIDLTPVLPGGENGGAMLFVLELIKYLAANNLKTKLSCLHKPNRMMNWLIWIAKMYLE